MVGRLQAFPNQPVIIYFAIDGEDDALVRIGERLGARLWVSGCLAEPIGEVNGERLAWSVHTDTDDTQSFMAEDYARVSNQDAVFPHLRISRPRNSLVFWDMTLPPGRKLHVNQSVRRHRHRHRRSRIATHSNRGLYAELCAGRGQLKV